MQFLVAQVRIIAQEYVVMQYAGLMFEIKNHSWRPFKSRNPDYHENSSRNQNIKLCQMKIITTIIDSETKAST